MDLHAIPPDQLLCQPINLFNNQWLLLSSGNYELKRWNCMTISWGSLGVMWNRPFVQVVVRPSRYTFGFMNEFEDFTLCAFPPEFHHRLQVLGSKSGRKFDKMKCSGLTPIAAPAVASPAYAEACLVLGCKKLYWQDMNAANFLDPKINTLYNGNDHHRIFFGEIHSVLGNPEFLNPI